MGILIRQWRTEDLPAVRRILWESWMAAYSAFIPEEDLRSYHEATYRIDSLAHLYKSTFVHGFIGEADGATGGAIDDALATIKVPPFTAELHGVGEFGGKRPHSLWAGVDDEAPLNHLNRKIESALQRIGLEAERRKFTPHVTLARLKGTPRGAVVDFLADHALFASAPFGVESFVLFSSHLASNGSLYRQEQVYALKG